MSRPRAFPALVLAIVAASAATSLAQTRPQPPTTRRPPPQVGRPGAATPKLPARPMARPAAKSLARYVPVENLVGLLEFEGLDAHAAAWKKTAAYKLLTETKTGPMLESLVSQGAEAALKSAPPGGPSAKEVVAMLKFAANKGFVMSFHMNGDGPNSARVGGAIRGIATEPGFAKILAMVGGRPEVKTEERQGRSIKINGQDEQGGWWAQGDDLVIASMEYINVTLNAIDGKAKSAELHPLRVELVRPTAEGFEPVLLSFLDVKKLPPLPPQAAAMGLDGIKQVDMRMGFQDDALVSLSRVHAPAPRKGLLTILDGPKFTFKDLPPMPAGVGSFAAASLDLKMIYAKIVEVAKATEPQASPHIDGVEAMVQQATGLRLQEDILAHLGPKFAAYAKPGKGFTVPLPPQAAAMGGPAGLEIPRMTFLIQTDDSDAMGKLLDQLMPIVNTQIPPAPGGVRLQFAKLPGGDTAYGLNLPPLPGALATLKPSIVVGKKHAAIALTTDDARSAVKLETATTGRYLPPAKAAAMARRVPKDLVFLMVSDPADSVGMMIQNLPKGLEAAQQTMRQARNGAPGAAPDGPTIRLQPSQIPSAAEVNKYLYPASYALAIDDGGWTFTSREAVPNLGSPAMAGLGVGLLLPAVQAAREAARRAQCVNNLKQIGLAMHNYHSANDSLPPAAILSKDGKPLLSWRVAILPYIEQQALYNEFKLDEAWDSPHNKPLIDRIPITYLCPSRPGTKDGTTTYRVVTGKGGLFDLPKGVKFTEVPDGLSNTLAVVEASESVPWTKPEGLPLEVDPAAVLKQVGSNHAGGFNALLGDGSVRFIKMTVKMETLRALMTRDGGEIISADSF